MKTKFIEAVGIQPSGAVGNYGKFAVAHFEMDEWDRRSVVDAEQGRDVSLLGRCGWSTEHYFVTDLQTGEGAMFRFGGYPKADLEKHAVWVCPLFEPFLEWLYEQHSLRSASMAEGPIGLPWRGFLASLPNRIEINLPLEFAGYRRPGPQGATS